jgi:hypothetical protein
MATMQRSWKRGEKDGSNRFVSVMIHSPVLSSQSEFSKNKEERVIVLSAPYHP